MPKLSFSELPFYNASKDELAANFLGLTDSNLDFLKNVPNFNIKSLVDSLPGENYAKDEFIYETIESRYYQPIEFKVDKFGKNKFSIAHMNISSLTLHIDELRTLLKLLDSSFDVIAITETRLLCQDPTVDIAIQGYDFPHTVTHTSKGGSGFYIKSTLDYDILNDYCVSLDNVCETIFIEIKNAKQKNIILGCIYRHHTKIDTFYEQFMKKTLRKITKSKKIFALIGDFNINSLEYSNHLPTSKYYDQVSSSGFRPLILQPTRVTNRSATLIDNIFLNDLSCTSKGGNIITSISDHFMQFCYLDVFHNSKDKIKSLKSSRNWRIFNKREFESEFSQIDWNSKLSPTLDVNKSSQVFYETITQLLNEMAPFKKLTKKEFSLRQSPWITPGILKSMKVRDKHGPLTKA